MDLYSALFKLQALIGEDLHTRAGELEVTVRCSTTGKINKGWAGHTVERHLGLPQNSCQSPNLGSWELKVVPLKLDKDGQLTVKETMAITMIDPWEVKQKCFRESHLFSKISKLIVVSRLVKDGDDESIVLDCTQFLLANSGLMASIMRDYDEIRDSLLGGKPLSGKMGKYIQPRTKGSGHGSVSRAFYARKEFVGRAIDLESINRQILIDSTGRVTVRGKQHPVGTSGHFPMDCHDRTNPNSDCRLHAGKDNAPNRFELDALMRGLPNNQSGAGRHKCVYCAYKAGYRLGLKRG